MENPAVVVKVRVTRPSAEVPFWGETDEGNLLTHLVATIHDAYSADIQSTKIVIDELVFDTVIEYSSKEIYEESRKTCLDLVPTFLEVRDQYYRNVGGSVTQEVTLL